MSLNEVHLQITQHFTKIDQEKCKIEQICIWNPMTVPDLLRTIKLINVISVEFLTLSRRHSSSQNIASGEEWREMAVFTG